MTETSQFTGSPKRIPDIRSSGNSLPLDRHASGKRGRQRTADNQWSVSMGIAAIGGTAVTSATAVSNASRTNPPTDRIQTTPASGSADDSVTLSPEALALSSLNEKGVTVSLVPLSLPDPGGAPQWIPLKGHDGSVSKSAFESITASFDVSSSAADQMFKQMDANGDGALSDDEFIKALGATSSNATASSNVILQMMDTDHNGTVSGEEFLHLESAVVQAEN